MLFTYKVKVEPSNETDTPLTRLWGNETLPAVEDSRLAVVIRLEPESETIELFKSTASSPDEKLGVIRAGEIYMVPLQGIVAISARCSPANENTNVLCAVIRM